MAGENLFHQKKLREFEAVFYPRSIAVVGVSRDKQSRANRYFRALLNQGFKGKLYPVNPNSNDILELKSLP